MAHDLSLTYSRFDHMSPSGVALATLLHALVALAFWWVSPLHHTDQTPDPIEITMEQEAPPPPPPAPRRQRRRRPLPRRPLHRHRRRHSLRCKRRLPGWA